MILSIIFCFMGPWILISLISFLLSNDHRVQYNSQKNAYAENTAFHERSKEPQWLRKCIHCSHQLPINQFRENSLYCIRCAHRQD
ncbi:MAG: hypothetical protein FJ161_04430 [Gammaproteobacteria bacterium]|nr:hypothetical protein [Gammaproteobacteria bacterium]